MGPRTGSDVAVAPISARSNATSNATCRPAWGGDIGMHQDQRLVLRTRTSSTFARRTRPQAVAAQDAEEYPSGCRRLRRPSSGDGCSHRVRRCSSGDLRESVFTTPLLITYPPSRDRASPAHATRQSSCCLCDQKHLALYALSCLVSGPCAAKVARQHLSRHSWRKPARQPHGGQRSSPGSIRALTPASSAGAAPVHSRFGSVSHGP